MHAVSSLLSLIAFLLVTLPGESRAERPLVLEDLLTEKGRLRADLAVSYSNVEDSGLSAGEPITVQTGPTSFLTFPSAIGERTEAREAVILSMGMRYGYTAKTELYTRTNWIYDRQRSEGVTGSEQKSTSRFADVWLGVSHRFKEDADSPAIIGFSEVALWEKNLYTASSFKSALFGLTTYRAIDPVVLTLTGAYRINQSRKDGSGHYKPGNLLLISPSIGFAANDQITLLTGLQWTNRQPETRKGFQHGRSRNHMDLLLGVGYGISEDSILNVTLRENISGGGGAALRINLLHTI